MAVRLEDMLRPGERVVWRVPRERLPEAWRSELAVALFVTTVFVWVGLSISDWTVAATLAAAFALLFGLRFVVLRGADEDCDAAVTDQRAFTIDTTGEALAFASVELADVSALEVRWTTVPVTKTDGTAVELAHPSRTVALGRALAEAAGLPEPGSRARKVDAAGNALELSLSMGPLFVITMSSIAGFEFSAHPWPLWLLYTALYVTAAILLWWFGGGLVGLLLRPFLTREELHGIVLRNRFLMSHPDAPEDNGPIPRLYLRLVDRLYGGPGNGTTAQGENHGA